MMPCEHCHCQFSVFRRKRNCGNCKRYFCINCLHKSRKLLVCEMCLVFMKRPLNRVDLLNVTSKDLIFFCKTRDISTAGCLERDDLIGLILNYSQNKNENSFDPNSSSSNSSENISPKRNVSTKDDSEVFKTSLDNLKQTCQNFFSQLSENITESLSSLDGRPNLKPDENLTNFYENSDIPQQPGVKREIIVRELPTYADSQINHREEKRTYTNKNCSTSNIDYNIAGSSNVFNNINIGLKNDQPILNSNLYSNFESDDKNIHNSFNEQYDKSSDCLDNTEREKDNIQEENIEMKNENGCESFSSSFEELGAIGGLSDDYRTMTEPDSNNLEQWLLLDLKNNDGMNNEFDNNRKSYTNQYEINKTDGQMQEQQGRDFHDQTNLRVKNGDEMATTSKDQHLNDKQNYDKSERNMDEDSNIGVNLKIMQENLLQELDTYFRSLGESSQSNRNDRFSTNFSNSEMDISSDECKNTCEGDNISLTDGIDSPRFKNLGQVETLEQLDHLTVKQLKEVLMFNRVDYKGCCEKKELLDRVKTLWKNFKSTPAVEKLPPTDLCKICMDAPIECVILECGHMATCTNCGKVLSECPICRQYIVRVVRFFRA